MVTNVRAQQEYTATHYGTSFQGRPLGCNGAGYYDSTNPRILAVGPSLYQTIPCGTQVTIVGPTGTLVVTRMDSCPGCDRLNMLDLSEAGITIVCGGLYTCKVTIEY